MISESLKKIFFLSISLFMLHWLEEYITLYTKINFIIAYQWPYITPGKSTFIWIGAFTWLIFLFCAFLISKKKFPLPLMLFFATFYTYQAEHIIHFFKMGEYYPGLVTGTALTILGIFFWRQLVIDLGRMS